MSAHRQTLRVDAPPPEGAGQRWRSRAGVWTAVAAAAVVLAVNVLGIWSIRSARRGARQEALRLFRLETTGRARSVESVLASTRAELAFLASSSAILRLARADARASERDASWRQQAAESALLLFLRAHREVRRLVVTTSSSGPLLESGRRGDVPVVWRPRDRPADAAVAAASAHNGGSVRGEFGLEAPGEAEEAIRVLAELEVAALLSLANTRVASAPFCELRDASGRLLADNPPGEPDPGLTTEPHFPSMEAAVVADGWGAPSPWRLKCSRSSATTARLFEPIVARARRTVVLNLVVMVLAALLGGVAIQQSRRRERVEARAREEVRVRELERQLFHSERLATVGRLAAGMAHEINNPLEGMSNYLSLARSDVARGDLAAARERLEGVEVGLERIAGIVRQVLAHADPARSPQAVLDLRPVVRQTLDFVHARQGFDTIAFRAELPEQPLWVRGSSVMLGQVVLNLVLNACEAQPDGGEVLVEAENGADHVELRVADRGPGVPASELPRIFEPFYSTRRSTGLGLSICHAIVTEHDGELSAAGRAGGGAVFTLRLPAHVVPEQTLGVAAR
jgi:signal transduction histidine kinase